MKEQIDACFEGKTEQTEVLIELYRLAFPDWDDLRSIDGWPKVSEATSSYIAKKFIEFDQKHHPGECLPGGLWMNRGFSTDKMEDWVINAEDCVTEYI